MVADGSVLYDYLWIGHGWLQIHLALGTYNTYFPLVYVGR